MGLDLHSTTLRDFHQLQARFVAVHMATGFQARFEKKQVKFWDESGVAGQGISRF